MSVTTFPALASGRRMPNLWDLLTLLCVFGALIAIVHVTPDTFKPLDAPNATSVDLDPMRLPEYALRTTMRMFAALAASLRVHLHLRDRSPPRAGAPGWS